MKGQNTWILLEHLTRNETSNHIKIIKTSNIQLCLKFYTGKTERNDDMDDKFWTNSGFRDRSTYFLMNWIC